MELKNNTQKVYSCFSIGFRKEFSNFMKLTKTKFKGSKSRHLTKNLTIYIIIWKNIRTFFNQQIIDILFLNEIIFLKLGGQKKKNQFLTKIRPPTHQPEIPTKTKSNLERTSLENLLM